ncbi:MAG: hypothetical protein J7K54_04940 [Candidatus Aenigmarchaeota archaeon]|nr:hypothetical protein [Candidatus Aenigmarchaeota archaeon]
MKHTLSVTMVLVIVFLFIQIFGLYAFSQSMHITTNDNGSRSVSYADTAVGERPEIEGAVSLLYILFGILIGTGIVMMFARFGQVNLWKIMYFMAVWLASAITLGVFISPTMAMAVAAVLALLELVRTNIYIHNITEILIYPGIALLFAPLFNIYWAAMLLLAISAYDMFAVWKSGHMITLAKFQTGTRAFAGFVVPYGIGRKGGIKTDIPRGVKVRGMKTAILGGGDIAFPLVFSAVALDWLIRYTGVSLFHAFLESLIIPLFTAAALLALFVKAEKDKFYPAMPFVTAGCFAGFAVVWLLSIF